MDGWVLPPDFESDTAEAERARKAFGARVIEEDRAQYLTVGLQLGERYETSPIVWHDGSPSPPDTWDLYTPLDRPGARAPHVWLAPGRALFDEFGRGFTVLDFGAPDHAAALESAARARGVPLKVVAPNVPGESPYRSKLVLVRPDQHIAWHGDAVSDPLRGDRPRARRMSISRRHSLAPSLLSFGKCRLSSLARQRALCGAWEEAMLRLAVVVLGIVATMAFEVVYARAQEVDSQVQPLSGTDELLPGRCGRAMGEGARDEDERTRKGGNPQRDVPVRQNL